MTEKVSTEEKLNKLRKAGLVVWSGRKLASVLPMIRSKGDKTVTELLLENRESSHWKDAESER
ncbi:MAG: hypothetical protein ACOC9Z_00695 [Chloroflexota bacterium]